MINKIFLSLSLFILSSNIYADIKVDVSSKENEINELIFDIPFHEVIYPTSLENKMPTKKGANNNKSLLFSFDPELTGNYPVIVYFQDGTSKRFRLNLKNDINGVTWPNNAARESDKISDENILASGDKSITDIFTALSQTGTIPGFGEMEADLKLEIVDGKGNVILYVDEIKRLESYHNRIRVLQVSSAMGVPLQINARDFEYENVIAIELNDDVVGAEPILVIQLEKKENLNE